MMSDRDDKGRLLVGTDPGPGRTGGYDPAMEEQAYKLALLGLTDEEKATFFGSSRNTFHRWKTEHPGFRDVVHRGKEIADADVAVSLYKRAKRMVVKSEKAMKGKDGGIVVAQTLTETPPDMKAAIHWLQLRCRSAWNADDVSTDAGVLNTGSNGCLFPSETVQSMTDEELQQRIKVLEARRREREGC